MLALLIFFSLYFSYIKRFKKFSFYVFQGPNKEGTCATCHGKFDSCPGHFGYIKLALPVYNVAYRDNIMNILKCICKVRKSSLPFSPLV